ncbi:MAG: glycosyltransferase family 4 protein [bacterium]|nr:glycosyltransferase family 4 protein [bacterium]
MKVLMFGWEFPPFISGGLGVASHGIASGLVNNGVEVTFVIPTKRKQELVPDINIRLLAADEVALSLAFAKTTKEYEEIKSQIDQKLLPLSPYYTSISQREMIEHFFGKVEQIWPEKRTVLDFAGNYGQDIFLEVGKYSIIGKYLGATEDFNVIHAHDWVAFPAGVEAKNISGKPLVIHIHATEFDRSGENVNQYVYDTERYGMENADRIITVSYYTRNIIINRYGIHPDKIEIVHNAVDKETHLARLGIVERPLKEKIVLFLGRVTMQKGPDYFLEAANLVLKRLKNVRFVMAGSGDMLPKMINRAAELKITDKFHFTGFLRGLEVERMYAVSDLYVMPSVSEPFGISAFEALLYDVPIIISKRAGVAEVLGDAMMVDFWDVQKLADRIIALLSNEALALDMVKRCQAEIKAISWNSAGGKIRDVYQSLL